MTIRRSPMTLSGLALLATIALAGCAPTPETSPKPLPSAEPTVKQPVEPPTAAAVEITSTEVRIVDDAGAPLASAAYTDATTVPALRDALDDAFDSEAPGVFEETTLGSWTTFDWGGFSLIEVEPTAEVTELVAFRVTVTTAEVAGLEIRTGEDVVVGDAETAVAPLSYREWLDTGGSMNVQFYLFDESPVDGVDYPDYEPAAFSVRVWVDPTTTLVTRFDAPARNWGA